MPEIELSRVRKVFPASAGSTSFPGTAQGLVALDGVSFRVKSGERIGVIGRNGAGKSTLLHLVAGIASPSSGTINVRGHVTSVLTLGIGVREDLTGRENIYLDGQVQGRSRNEVDEVIRQIIDFAELGEFIDYPVRTYSTGMKARLMFAMISYIDPEILLIDEALSAGDHAFGKKAARRIKEICGRGKIVIVVSHGLSSITDICNRCIWLDAGRVVMDGPPHEVTGEYLKSIREADEAEVLERFRSHVGKESLRLGYRILDARVRYANESISRTIVETGADVVIEMDCEAPIATSHADLHIIVERIDGLVLMDELMSESRGSFLSAGQSRVSLGISPFVLGYGVYQLAIRLMAEGLATAIYTTIFEVVTPSPARGGRPALVYPHVVSSASAQ